MNGEKWNGKESIVYRPKDGPKPIERPASTLLVMLQCAPAPVHDAPFPSAVASIVIPQEKPYLRFERAVEYMRQNRGYDPDEKATASNKVPVFKSGLYGRSKLD